MDQADQTTVRRRRVFYIPGYDPIHPRRYRELYRTESTAQAGISGYEVKLAPKSGQHYGWRVLGQMDGQSTSAEVDVLVWSDIVRGSMASSIPATYLQLVRTAWTYIASGALRRLMWLRKGPVIAALYPVGMLILQLLVAVVLASLAAKGLGWIMTTGARGVISIVGRGEGTPFDYSALIFGRTVLMWAFGAWVGWSVLRWFKRKDGKFFAYYLMHDYAYSAHWNGANPPELEARMAEFKDTIAAALRDDVDEVLVVGHSSGAHLAVSVLADLIREGGVPADGPALGFLSLGQVVPMVSFLPKAHRLRADLQYLSTRDELAWVDVTAPGDGCAFALCDPVAVSGVATDDQKWPLVISAAFTQTLSPQTWKKLRWRFFRLHFQYLCAFDRVGDYDYFRITAGPLTLAQRFAGRKPSQSRIDIAASKYTSVSDDG
ncbi:alpha/beta hydrolase [Pseudooctadecabacter sp.]|uniref:alpha/beta hydrolase n=1 Tax=Pseudooctadecabacter sp. TaxID=1966338 RepID=UPI0025ED39DD|nr:alpha/beta hydrolase [Pseudooctadecabacter sp.]